MPWQLPFARLAILEIKGRFSTKHNMPILELKTLKSQSEEKELCEECGEELAGGKCPHCNPDEESDVESAEEELDEEEDEEE